jgi:hypothetical protein
VFDRLSGSNEIGFHDSHQHQIQTQGHQSASFSRIKDVLRDCRVTIVVGQAQLDMTGQHSLAHGERFDGSSRYSISKPSGKQS